MATVITAVVGQHKKTSIIVAALLLAGAAGGWIIPTLPASKASAVEELTAYAADRKGDAKALSLEEIKAGLIGSYVATGTDPDGKAYVGDQTLSIALAPSGALEVEWDGGRNVGIGHIIGNVLAVASWARGRTVIMSMTINPDGSLSGKWSRRTDLGSRGTETWKRR